MSLLLFLSQSDILPFWRFNFYFFMPIDIPGVFQVGAASFYPGLLIPISCKLPVRLILSRFRFSVGRKAGMHPMDIYLNQSCLMSKLNFAALPF